MRCLSKMKLVLIVVISAVVLVAVAIGIIYSVLQIQVLDKHGMVYEKANIVDECVYSLHGGMEGESLYIRLSADKNGNAAIEFSRTEFNGASEETRTGSVPFEAIEKIRSVCTEYGVMSWGELKNSELIALDAPTVSLTFSVKEEDYSVTINSNQALPKGSNGIFNEVYSILMSYLQGDD